MTFRTFVRLAMICVVAFGCCGAGVSQAQVSDIETASYTDALAYCRGEVARPTTLRNDRRVLCHDGRVSAENQIWLAHNLEQGGFFVVRSFGGDIVATIALAEMLLLREAIVVVNDYCLGTCANYLLIASATTFVPKDAVVAWTAHSEPRDCVLFRRAPDRTAPRVPATRCSDVSLDAFGQHVAGLKSKFYKGRVSVPPFTDPPESLAIQKILKRKFDGTGRYPDGVHWTWHPRYYANAIRTKIVYEAYPQSQDEVDAIVARLGLPYSVIYDP